MYHIMETFSNFFIKKNILTISSFEESFFLYKKLDKKIKLTKEIIALNYGQESPYREDILNITSVIDDKNLYLWFHKKNTVSKFLPLSLLIFRRLVVEYKNTICIFKGNPNKILIIKNSHLIDSFIKRNLHEKDITLMKTEYFVEDVVFFNEHEFEPLIKGSFQYLTFRDLLNILNIQIDFKKLINNFIKWIALPFLISSILLILIIGSYNHYKQIANEKLLLEYRNKKSLTEKMKDNILKNEELNKVFTQLSNEFKYIDKSVVLSEVLKVSKDINVSLEFIRIENINVNFVLVTKDEEKIPLLTTKLFETNLFQDVKNISSQKIRKVLTRATMQATLKER